MSSKSTRWLAMVVAALLASCAAGNGYEHQMLPTVEPLGDATADRIVAATVLLLAPDRNGKFRYGSFGTGSIIAADADRAWIVTCRHVAMPRGPSPHGATVVAVRIADGRNGLATVRWTAPALDLALLELPLERPPPPVPLAFDTSSVQRGSDVMFVPNPYRAGWLLRRGRVVGRELLDTPAGPYQLVVTDIAMGTGDSGSGLFDARGQLIGINTWARRTGDAWHGIGLPSETMRVLGDALRTGQLDRLGKPGRSAPR